MAKGDHLFKPGERPVGRQKGTPNKVTTSIKQAFKDAFDLKGGVPALLTWAQQPENETEFYKLVTKLIPTEIATDPQNPITIVTRIERKIVE